MPLSEHEQRLLDQIERALYQEDPKFASTVRSTDLRTHMRRRLRRAALVLVLGLLLLLTGTIIHQTLVGLAGFVVMVAALLLALSSWKRLGAAPGLRAVGSEAHPVKKRRGQRRTGPPTSRGGSSGSSGIMSRLEERWKRRWDERGQ